MTRACGINADKIRKCATRLDISLEDHRGLRTLPKCDLEALRSAPGPVDTSRSQDGPDCILEALSERTMREAFIRLLERDIDYVPATRHRPYFGGVTGVTSMLRDMDEPSTSQDFARVKLNGERFAGARLPVSALAELENYTNLIREAAKLAWRDDHPNEDLPEGFGADFDLVLTSIHNGSADCHLERLRPHLGDVEDYFDQSRDRVGRELRQVLQGRVEETDDLLARIDAFGELGSSLDVGDSLEVASADLDEEPVRITRSTYREYIRPAHERSIQQDLISTHVRGSLYSENGWVVGRLGGLNVDDSRFDLSTEKYGDIYGRWNNLQVLEDLRAVLRSSEQAAIVRIYGSLRLRSENNLFRLNDASNVEFLAMQGEPWSRRFVELASLRAGWNDEDPDSEPVSGAALDGARKVLLHARFHGKQQPGVFPKVNGGVGLEWASPQDVVSIEVSPDVEFFLFRLGPNNDVFSNETIDISEVEAFIEAVEF